MLENQNIEWKEIWRDDYLKWICGFANANGGKIFIGKKDNGEISGLDNPKKLLEDLPNKIQAHLGILCDVNLHTKNKLSYIEIDVKPYNVPISFQGKYHYRSGSTKQELKGNALNDFLLKKAGKTWDDVTEPRASFDDINLSSINAFKNGASNSKRLPFIHKEKDPLRILDNLLLLENDKFKRSAILLFGTNPNRFYINAFVKIGRFGKSDDDLRFQEVIEGNIFELADKVLDALDKKFLISPISYEGLQRVEKWEYPYDAIREVILNAIVHKDYMGAPIQISVYDNKLVVWNEGQLADGMTFEDLKKKHSSRPHNPILASVFFKGGLIESWGRGTIKIVRECHNSGLPEPIFEASSGGISVTLFKRTYTKKLESDRSSINERQVKAINYVKEKGKITNRDYQKLNSVNPRTSSRDLLKLCKLGIFLLKGKGPATIYEFNPDFNQDIIRT